MATAGDMALPRSDVARITLAVLFIGGLIAGTLWILAPFLAAFIWAVRSGQYEDTCTPSMRLLLDDPAAKPAETGKIFPTIKKTNNDEP